ncbi:hypothetical protein, partial [Yinghuangia sp. YIM S10712]|uniref:hypothetical protein n=1 Tax=Yinghuangia sp. YIM S10712 TaxID=3436930 RepID=UPI003F530AEC
MPTPIPERARETASRTAHIAATKAEAVRDRAVATGRQLGEHTPPQVKAVAEDAAAKATRNPAPAIGLVAAGVLVLLLVRRSRR